MSVAYQIAQKLHACTDVKTDLPDGDEPNNRFHDLLDLLLLEELVDDEGWAKVRDACSETFALRQKQSWPPRVMIYPSWPAGYSRIAAENAFPISDIDDASRRVRAMIDRIAAATP